jgi:predicted nucleic acid-binding protein
MDWVLDASLALAWALPDELSVRAEELLKETWGKGSFWVPALWWYELSNGLVMAQRKYRVSEADRNRLMEIYGMLPIQTDVFVSADLAWRLQAIAQEHSLTCYDAAYLELAERRGLGLATTDQSLAMAARKAGITVF